MPSGRSTAFCRLSLEVTLVQGRWWVKVPTTPPVSAEGRSRDEALALAQARALRQLADQLERSDTAPSDQVTVVLTTP